MCLFLFSNCDKLCDGCCKSIVSCLKSLNPLALILSLITCPIAMVIVLVTGLPVALYKWLPGVAHHESAMWKDYCDVMKRGKDAYEGKNKRGCCDACLSEVDVAEGR